MKVLKQKAEGIINLINHGIDFQLLQEIIKITMNSKRDGSPAWINCMTYEEWFKHFSEKSKKIVISEEHITLVLDYLKLNYNDLFTTVIDISKPNMAVNKKFNWDKINLEFTETIYSIIQMWENSKTLTK